MPALSGDSAQTAPATIHNTPQRSRNGLASPYRKRVKLCRLAESTSCNAVAAWLLVTVIACSIRTVEIWPETIHANYSVSQSIFQ